METESIFCACLQHASSTHKIVNCRIDRAPCVTGLPCSDGGRFTFSAAVLTVNNTVAVLTGLVLDAAAAK